MKSPLASFMVLHADCSEDASAARELASALEDDGFEVIPTPAFSQSVRDWARSAGQKLNRHCAVILIWSQDASESAHIQATIAQSLQSGEMPVYGVLMPGAPEKIRMTSPTRMVSWKDYASGKARLQALGIERPKTGDASDFDASVSLYLAEAKKLFGAISVLGDGDQLDLATVYQSLRMVEHGTSDLQRSVLEEDLVRSRTWQHVFVTGSPGTGKTTTLRYLAYWCSLHQGDFIPVFIRLPQLAERGEALEDEVRRRVKGSIHSTGLMHLERHSSFLGDRYVLLLDGYDEVSEQLRGSVIKRISEFCEDHPRSRVIIGSRPRELLGSGLPPALGNFRVLTLLPFTDEDVRSYLDRVLSADDSAATFAIVMKDERLLEIARVPFLLALLARFGVKNVAQSRERALLFDSCVKYLIGVKDWEKAPGRPKILPDRARLLERVLKRVGVQFYKLDVDGEFSRVQILSVIDDESHSTVDADSVLEQILSQTGLLQSVGDSITFIHRSIWEYFVASAMLDEPLSNLVERATSQKWEEPTRLYVGLVDRSRLDEVLSSIWSRNKGLALRAIADLSDPPVNLLRLLCSETPQKERLSIVREIEGSTVFADRSEKRRRALIETLPPLLDVEANAQVIFEALSLLDRNTDIISDSDRSRIKGRVLDLERAVERRTALVNNASFKFEFEKIPGGTFQMGGDHPERPQWMEGPVHTVEISSFYMSRFCVTNKLFYESGFPFEFDRRKAPGDGPNQPVAGVTWYEAALFAMWLGCRLPTEAEWEYCCRAGGRDDALLKDPAFLIEHAWFTANSGNMTHDVGLLKPNSFNLYDMLGNVREWCNDWLSENYYEECLKQGTVKDPKGPMLGSSKILRGGCFDWNILNLVPTYRNYKTAEEPYFTNGFRLALSL